jgi:hypothetical protein
MPVPHAVPPTIRTDADRRAFEAGRRAGLAVAAIVRERAEPEEPPGDLAGAEKRRRRVRTAPRPAY